MGRRKQSKSDAEEYNMTNKEIRDKYTQVTENWLQEQCKETELYDAKD